MEGVFLHSRFMIRFALVKAYFAYGIGAQTLWSQGGRTFKMNSSRRWKREQVAELKFSVKSSKNAM